MKEETMSSNCRFTLDESLSLATVMVSRSSRSALSEEAGRSTPMRRALALLRTRRERPRHSRAADQRDEVAAPCMSGKQHSEGRRGFGHDRLPVATGSPQALRILNRE
jgi:hypothetical protein